MKSTILLLVCLLINNLYSWGQIQFEGCGEVRNSIFDNKTLYVVQDQHNEQRFGKVIFKPAEGGRPWTFSWTYNGVHQSVSVEDTLQLEVDLLGSGFYTFQAEKDGVFSQSASQFHLFYDYVPDFSIALADELNCFAISIAPVTDFQIPQYTYEGKTTEGIEKVGYTLPGKSTPIYFDSYDLAFKEKQEALQVDAEDQEVTISITDRFGFTWTSSPVHYTSVIPRAEAELELENKVHIVGEVHEEMGQAPLDVKFSSEQSVNALTYEWLLYKDTTDMVTVGHELIDSLINEQVIRTEAEAIFYTYEYTGRYKVRLIAINGAGNHCADTSAVFYINVVESLLDVPNVFTPNGDGKNDVFMVRALSVGDFHGVILNRWGRKVYEWSSPLEGWDGRIHGKYASPGTYYYIITARGLEKTNPPKYVKKGALMLIR